GSPLLVEQIKDDNIFRSLDDPGRPVVVQNDARESLRIATGYPVIRQSGRNLCDPERGLIRQKRFAALGSERQLVFRLSVRWHLLRASGIDARARAGRRFPNSGYITPWSGSRLFAAAVKIVDCPGLPHLCLSARLS